MDDAEKSRRLNFTVDCDSKAYTDDPDLWLAFARQVHRRGHSIVGITAADHAAPRDQKFRVACDDFYCTAGQDPKLYLEQYIGLQTNVWVKDLNFEETPP